MRFHDKVVHISHANFTQNSEFADENHRYYNRCSFNETILTGTHNLIHKICLSFILQLRLINGSFYQDIIAKSHDINFVSDAFATIMHPGYS